MGEGAAPAFLVCDLFVDIFSSSTCLLGVGKTLKGQGILGSFKGSTVHTQASLSCSYGHAENLCPRNPGLQGQPHCGGGFVHGQG